jgi:hypothetical protein
MGVIPCEKWGSTNLVSLNLQSLDFTDIVMVN